MTPSLSEDWIIGLLGLAVMAFFIGCTSCWPYKSEDSSRRRQPPPPPSPSLEVRYQHDFYPPNPPPEEATQHPVHMNPSTVRDVNGAQPPNVKEQNSATLTSAGESRADQGNYVNLVPVSKDPPIYLQIVSDTDVKTGDKEKEEIFSVSEGKFSSGQTPRSAVNSIGKDSAHSDGPYHSYENVAMEAPPSQTPRSAINSIGKDSAHSDGPYHSYENVAIGSPPIGPESDLDYENM